MKKVLFMALAVAGLCMTSCKDKANEVKADENAKTEEVANVEAVDPASDPSIELSKAMEAKDQSKFEALLNTVKEKAADPKFKEYIEKAQNFLKEKAADIKAFIGDNKVVSGLIDNVSSIDVAKLVGADAAANAVEGAKDAVEGAADKAVETGKDAVEGVKNAGEKVVEDVKGAADKAVEGAKDAAKNAGDAAKKAASDAVDKGADAAKKALGI